MYIYAFRCMYMLTYIYIYTYIYIDTHKYMYMATGRGLGSELCTGRRVSAGRPRTSVRWKELSLKTCPGD